MYSQTFLVRNKTKAAYSYLDIPVFNIFNENDAEDTADYLLKRLAEYSAIESVY